MSYPIGSIYQSTNSTNPSNIFGGTWSQIKDRFLLACGDNYANGSVGGEAAHTLTINEIPSHTHTSAGRYSGTDDSNFSGHISNGVCCNDTSTLKDNLVTGATGGSSAHNNMPPYFAIYTWYRTA